MRKRQNNFLALFLLSGNYRDYIIPGVSYSVEREEALMPSDELTVGTRLNRDRYEVIKKIGKGGMGYVYKAKDHEKDYFVALKQTLFSSQSHEREQEQFAQEADLLTRLDHPGLPKVRDYFVEESGRYLVMDYIEGPDVGTLLQTGFVFPPSFALAIFESLLDIVDYIHSQSPIVIHRDIKPQNIKISKDGQVFLLDFGLAKDTGTGTIIRGFSPHYSPLEQRQGLTTGERGDLYSLGATLYHIVTGTLPYDALEKRLPELQRTQQDPLPSILKLNPSAPSFFASIIERAMAIYPEGRPASAKEILASLRQGSVAASDVSTLLRVPALAPTAIDQSASQNYTGPKTKQFTVAKDKTVYKYSGGKVIATYSPPVLTSPTTIRPESLKLLVKPSIDFSAEITDPDFDPVNGAGKVYHSAHYENVSLYYDKTIDLPLESLPRIFHLWIQRSNSDIWESAEFHRYSSVLKAQLLE